MRRRLLTALGLTLVFGVTTGCTQEENFLWNVFNHEAPAEAAALASTMTATEVTDGVPVLTPEQLAAWKTQLDALIARTPCERADDMIDSIGLPSHFHDVVRRESGCDPRAYNASGASGALQIMPGWAGSCGTVWGDRAAGTGLFDLWTNIQCGDYVYGVQGGGAWSTWGGG